MVGNVQVRSHIDEKGELTVKRKLQGFTTNQNQQRMSGARPTPGLILLVLIFSFISTVYPRQTTQPIGITEKLGQFIPLDVELYDESGNLIQLKSIINKPTLITPVYYECTGICTPLLNEVAKVIDKMDLVMGKDYQILTISFDFTERPETASEKRDNYLSEIKKSVDPSGWRFFTGDSVNVHRFTDAMGFYYQQSGKEWIHPTALIAVSPEGKITRYLYGIHQLPLDVKLAVMEASQGHSAPTISKVLNMCYTYDPEGKHYVFNFVHVGGVVIVGLVALFVVVFIVIPKKKKERQ
jgi:protein SCO1/2